MVTSRRNPANMVQSYILRLPMLRDVDRITRLVQDRDIARYTLMPHPYSADDARAFVRLARKGSRDGSSFHFMLVEEQSNDVVGGIGLMHVSRIHLNAEVGYWLARSERGQGLMKQVLQSVCGFGFTVLGLKRLYAMTDTENERSQRLLHSCGFVQEGYLRKHIRRFGKRRDLLYWGLLRAEWSAGRTTGKSIRIIH